MKYRINITDKNNNPVYEGAYFLVRMVEPSFSKPTLVKVVKDISQENMEFDRDFDVEDSDGNRIWNAYMVIKCGEKVSPQYRNA